VRSTILALLGAASLLAAADSAVAAPVDEFVKLRAAQLIDYECEALSYLEQVYLNTAQNHWLDQTPEYQSLLESSTTPEQYGEWIRAREAEAQAMAGEVGGCTPAAEPYLLQARGQANAFITQGLMLAFHFNSMLSDDPYRRAMEAGDQQAAMQYDGFLQNAFGQNYKPFMEAQNHAVSLLVPLRDPTMIELYGFDHLGFEEVRKMDEARLMAIRAANTVRFQIAAVNNGWAVFAKELEGGWSVPTLRAAGVTDRDQSLPVVEGPSAYALEAGGDTFQYAFVRMPDASLRLMLLGDATAKLGPDAVARLYIPTMPLPVGVDDWNYFNHSTFRDAAMVWDGIPVSSGCLGGPCYEFPSEVFDAIARRGEKGYAELFISADPAAQPPPIVSGNYRDGRVASRHFHTLSK
jgi:hypothetical protein